MFIFLVAQFGQVIPHLKAPAYSFSSSHFLVNSMTLHHDKGHSVKRTVEIGAVALWYRTAHKYCKNTISNYCCQKPAYFTFLSHFLMT